MEDSSLIGLFESDTSFLEELTGALPPPQGPQALPVGESLPPQPVQHVQQQTPMPVPSPQGQATYTQLGSQTSQQPMGQPLQHPVGMPPGPMGQKLPHYGNGMYGTPSQQPAQHHAHQGPQQGMMTSHPGQNFGSPPQGQHGGMGGLPPHPASFPGQYSGGRPGVQTTPPQQWGPGHGMPPASPYSQQQQQQQQRYMPGQQDFRARMGSPGPAQMRPSSYSSHQQGQQYPGGSMAGMGSPPPSNRMQTGMMNNMNQPRMDTMGGAPGRPQGGAPRMHSQHMNSGMMPPHQQVPPPRMPGQYHQQRYPMGMDPMQRAPNQDFVAQQQQHQQRQHYPGYMGAGGNAGPSQYGAVQQPQHPAMRGPMPPQSMPGGSFDPRMPSPHMTSHAISQQQPNGPPMFSQSSQPSPV